jgi:predicted TIM-barrel fold metal-dependent hydrolase
MMRSGGCDTHVHVVGDAHTYTMVHERQYTPGPAPLSALQAHLQNQGLTRAVIIQPSVYGTDNQCMLDALHAMQGQARGVAVLDTQTPKASLQTMDAQGVRGVRLNLESSGAHDVALNAEVLREALQTWAPRLAELGWHIQVYAPLAVTVACAACIRQLPVPVVLDHFALWADASCASLESSSLLQLLEAGRIYIKLSASYRSPIQDASALLALSQRLLAIRPDRLLWASDWPHTNREPGKGPHEVSRYRAIGADSLRHERKQWLPNTQLQQQVLVDNPNRLYRF